MPDQTITHSTIKLSATTDDGTTCVIEASGSELLLAKLVNEAGRGMVVEGPVRAELRDFDPTWTKTYAEGVALIQQAMAEAAAKVSAKSLDLDQIDLSQPGQVLAYVDELTAGANARIEIGGGDDGRADVVMHFESAGRSFELSAAKLAEVIDAARLLEGIDASLLRELLDTLGVELPGMNADPGDTVAEGEATALDDEPGAEVVEDNGPRDSGRPGRASLEWRFRSDILDDAGDDSSETQPQTAVGFIAALINTGAQALTNTDVSIGVSMNLPIGNVVTEVDSRAGESDSALDVATGGPGSGAGPAPPGPTPPGGVSSPVAPGGATPSAPAP